MCLLLCVCQTLAGLPDQDSYYDMVDCLEEQGIEATAQRHLSRKGTDLDLVEQFNIYEVRKPTVQTFISVQTCSVYLISQISAGNAVCVKIPVILYSLTVSLT